MKTTALIEKGKDGNFTIYTPDIEHTIIGIGETVKEAKADFENSINETLKVYENRETPEELEGIEFEYKYDISSVFNYYEFINVSKFAKYCGINESLMRQYKQGSTYISEKQVKKIEDSLHRIARDLVTIKLV